MTGVRKKSAEGAQDVGPEVLVGGTEPADIKHEPEPVGPTILVGQATKPVALPLRKKDAPQPDTATPSTSEQQE